MWHLEHVKSSMSELCVFSTVEYRERAGHVGFNSRDGPVVRRRPHCSRNGKQHPTSLGTGQLRS